MEGSRRKGYSWAISAGLNAAFAAISAKLFLPPVTCPFLNFLMLQSQISISLATHVHFLFTFLYFLKFYRFHTVNLTIFLFFKITHEFYIDFMESKIIPWLITDRKRMFLKFYSWLDMVWS